MYLLFLFLGFMPYYSSLIIFQKIHKNTRNVSSPHSITRRRRHTRRATASRRARPSPPTRRCRTTTTRTRRTTRRTRTRRRQRPSRSRSSTDTRSRPRPENTRNERKNEPMRNLLLSYQEVGLHISETHLPVRRLLDQLTQCH